MGRKIVEFVGSGDEDAERLWDPVPIESTSKLAIRSGWRMESPSFLPCLLLVLFLPHISLRCFVLFHCGVV